MARNLEWFKKNAELAYGELNKKVKQKEADEITDVSDTSVVETDNNVSCFDLHVNKDAAHNPHYFLSEELLVPHTNSTDKLVCQSAK